MQDPMMSKEWLDYMLWKYGVHPDQQKGGQPNAAPQPQNPSGTSGNPSQNAKSNSPNNPTTAKSTRPNTVVKHKGPSIGIDNYGKKPNLSPEDLARLRRANMMKEIPTAKRMILEGLSKLKQYGGAIGKGLGRASNPVGFAASAYTLYDMAKEERDYEQLLNAQMNADRADMGVELDVEASQGRRPLFASEYFMQNGAPSQSVNQTLAGDIELAQQLRQYLSEEEYSRAADKYEFEKALSSYNQFATESTNFEESDARFRAEQERSRREGTGPTPAYEPRRELKTQPIQQNNFFSEIESRMAEIFGR